MAYLNKSFKQRILLAPAMIRITFIWLIHIISRVCKKEQFGPSFGENPKKQEVSYCRTLKKACNSPCGSIIKNLLNSMNTNSSYHGCLLKPKNSLIFNYLFWKHLINEFQKSYLMITLTNPLFREKQTYDS